MSTLLKTSITFLALSLIAVASGYTMIAVMNTPDANIGAGLVVLLGYLLGITGGLLAISAGFKTTVKSMSQERKTSALKS